MNTYKAHLIDPVEQTVTEVEIDRDNGIEDLYKHLHCSIFTFVEINDKHDGIYVDDEGLYAPNQVFFLHKDYPYQPLAGYGLVIGTEWETGDSQDPTVTLEETREAITFMSQADVMIWLKDHPDA